MNDGSPHTDEKGWKPGDRARVLFRDGVRRPAALTAGFVWVSLDGDHLLNAVGGFDAEPLLAPVPTFPSGNLMSDDHQADT